VQDLDRGEDHPIVTPLQTIEGGQDLGSTGRLPPRDRAARCVANLRQGWRLHPLVHRDANWMVLMGDVDRAVLVHKEDAEPEQTEGTGTVALDANEHNSGGHRWALVVPKLGHSPSSRAPGAPRSAIEAAWPSSTQQCPTNRLPSWRYVTVLASDRGWNVWLAPEILATASYMAMSMRTRLCPRSSVVT